MKVFISWTKGITKSKEALDYIKNSPYITGIEITNFDEQIDDLIEANVPFSMHNTKINGFVFENKEFFEEKESFDRFLYLQSLAVPSFYGVHLGYVSNYDLDIVGLVNNFVKNVKLLDEKGFNKRVLFESPPFHGLVTTVRDRKLLLEEFEKFIPSEKSRKYMSLPENIAKYYNILKKECNCGYLFDISHLIISSENLRRYGIIDYSTEDYLAKVLDAVNFDVVQIHFNYYTRIAGDCLIDGHSGYFACRDSEKSIERLGSVLNKCQNVEAITFEIDTDFDPVEHVKALEENVKTVFEKVGFVVEK